MSKTNSQRIIQVGDIMKDVDINGDIRFLFEVLEIDTRLNMYRTNVFMIYGSPYSDVNTKQWVEDKDWIKLTELEKALL